MDLKNLFDVAKKVTVPNVTAKSGNGKLSFGIVNSKANGKRLTFSKALAASLGLDNKVNLIPIEDEHLLLVGKVVPNSAPIELNLRDCDGKKLAYNSDVVQLLTDIFELSFETHVSMAFQDISLEDYDGNPVAIIRLPSEHR